jgi:hypothetical protein
VELLEYLAPSETRPTPPDARPSDVAWWCIHFRARNASAVSMIETHAVRAKVARRASRADSRELNERTTSSMLLMDADSHWIALTATGG